MTRRLVSTVLLTLLGGCGGPADNDPHVLFYPPKDLILPAAGRLDANTPWSSIGVLNATWFPFEVKQANLSGEGATFLELDAPGGQVGATIGPRDSLVLKVRIKPPTVVERARWSTTDPENLLDATLEFTTSGTGKTDPNTGAKDLSAVKLEVHTVGLRFKLSCDLDGDGYDADDCSGGTDCNDTLAAINPEGDESHCDGIDNDCDGTPDDDCTPFP